ncbi:MAG: 16S rRNA (cytidine(1402)-2'-O)-methyltransferase [Defluviitaleaceae bacterium]|nr:16S rRNA (cytidine(1402)-2'-O)-methyltransferase [Defluviitaleaceae bacterium]
MTLYVVATPIGNLEDITARALRVLREVDIIAAEDTRHSRALLAHFGISGVPVYSCHKFNEEKRGDFFVQQMLDGKRVALVSDAGTPAISDPGHRLVRMAAAAGVEVVAVCGASAVVAALSVSGFDLDGFRFMGFLPRKKREIAQALAGQRGAVVFYESPRRIVATLGVVAEVFPGAEVCICNDLTKKFERVYRGVVAAVLEELPQNPDHEKGEYTCVVNLPEAAPEAASEETTSLESQLVDIMVKHGCNLKDASAKLRSMNEKLPKKEIYNAMLRLKGLLQQVE